MGGGGSDSLAYPTSGSPSERYVRFQAPPIASLSASPPGRARARGRETRLRIGRRKGRWARSPRCDRDLRFSEVLSLEAATRAPRLDHPGADCLITNRRLGRRAVFGTRNDAERFLDALAEVIDLGPLEVFAFVPMATRLRLFARSPVGEVGGGQARCPER